MTNEPPKYKCLICMSEFYKKSHLSKHIKSHKEPKTLQCPVCNKIYNTLKGLQVHINVVHDPGEKCEDCNEIFKPKKALEIHRQEVHLGQYNYYCDICRQGYVLYSDFRYHRESKHEPKKPCKLCGMLFPNTRSLRAHLEIHKQGKRKKRAFLECPICKESTNNLKRHYTQCHTDVKEFTCEICGKSFKELPTLNIHIMIHKGIRPHMCEVCGHGFLTKQHLIVHLRKHTGEKPYECEVCGKGFTRRGGLVNHFRIHSGEKPFICKYCEGTFMRKKYLDSHCLLKHKIRNSTHKEMME